MCIFVRLQEVYWKPAGNEFAQEQLASEEHVEEFDASLGRNRRAGVDTGLDDR